MTPPRGIDRFLRADRGAIAAEFAAIVLPLSLLLLGTIETSRVVWTRHAIEDAAAVGARCIGLRGAACTTGDALSLAAAADLVRSQAASWLVVLDDDAVTITPAGTCGTGPGFARVVIGHEMTGLMAGLSDMQLSAEACFPVMPGD